MTTLPASITPHVDLTGWCYALACPLCNWATPYTPEGPREPMCEHLTDPHMGDTRYHPQDHWFQTAALRTVWLEDRRAIPYGSPALASRSGVE